MPHTEDTGSARGGDPGQKSETHRCVQLLLERFPHLNAVSLQLLAHHETFRELCEEYEACTQAAERLERSGSDPAMLKEYSALRLRLEGELLRYISENSGAH
ncbi:MAG TPA: hypothetical protein VHK24_12385 [Steroidobacter sp.]|jgi:hypothetical protein|nr:hypothetical protein [Steroidobacter sp.]